MMLDNVQILKAIDDRQQRADGRPLWINAHTLFMEITGTYPTSEQAARFMQELHIANVAGLLTWQATNEAAIRRMQITTCSGSTSWL
jgi:hypothetical protein